MKKVIWVLAILTIAALGVFAYTVFYDMFKVDSADKASNESVNATEKTAGKDRDIIGGAVTDEELAEYDEKGLNPFGEDLALEDLTEADIQEYIHGMSHQKVQAEKKWGFYGLIPERVEWLLKGVEKASGLNHDELYESILTKWKKGDFSAVDKDHNDIWELQGGTVGKATGIMSEEEEKAYIESKK